MNANVRAMLACVVVSLFLGVTGCSHQPKRVDCDGRLEAINPPTPIADAKKSNDIGHKP